MLCAWVFGCILAANTGQVDDAVGTCGPSCWHWWSWRAGVGRCEGHAARSRRTVPGNAIHRLAPAETGLIAANPYDDPAMWADRFQEFKFGAIGTGVAVASVTDWRQYNEWYTRRRLGMVNEVPDVFKKTSPVNFAGQLQGNLLMVHGMLDDNVLFQDIVQFSQEAMKAGRHFDSLFYPRGDHGMGRIEERPHVYSAIVRYLYHKLNRPDGVPAIEPIVPKSGS